MQDFKAIGATSLELSRDKKLTTIHFFFFSMQIKNQERKWRNFTLAF